MTIYAVNKLVIAKSGRHFFIKKILPVIIDNGDHITLANLKNKQKS